VRILKLICVAGPTATGKTRLGVHLAKALGGEVLSCDSMQVYRRMDIGTAKATPAEMQGVPHHLLDVAEPWEDFSAGRYVELAAPLARELMAAGKRPIVVGGTGLYMDALVRGTDFAAAPTDGALRRVLAEKSGEELLRELTVFDPEAAAKLHPNNKKRIVRAIEVYRLTGETITEHDRRERERPDAFEAVRLILTFRDREILYRRIDARVDAMLERGLEGEVRALLEETPPPGKTAMAAIGYKEMAAHLRGECSLEEAAAQIKAASRRYAKRQLTWFGRHRDAHWLYVDDYPDFGDLERIATEIAAGRVG